MVTVGEIVDFLSAEAAAEIDRSHILTGVSAISGAGIESVVFAVNDDALAEALASPAQLIMAPVGSVLDGRVVGVKDPRLAFSLLYERWFNRRATGVHGTAVVEEGAVVGMDCWIGPQVVIHSGTTLGDRVRVQAGTVLGSDGFGYARGRGGYVGFPQIGTLWIGDDVEIGANVTIDRGALGETRIGRGTKIDNLVHIGHNCRIGEDVIIAAQVGMSGSCVIEDGAMLGGQVGLGENVTIGAGVMLGGQGGVLPGKKLEGSGKVFWGTPAQPVREYLRDLARLRKRGGG
jgi:UDP-3-O-[3-hydroxymyristoyl] glucosamine N-acyltransferase